MMVRRLALPALISLLALSAVGCAGWSLPGGANAPGVAEPPNAGGGGGGGVGGGIVPPAPGGGGVDPGDGARPAIEKPVPGQLNPMPVSVWKLQPSVDGHHVTVLLSWWSGVAPCSVLDSVEVARDGTTITMTPREGADPAAGGQLACPAIAMLRGTIVDLGELEPGTWTLAAPGDLAPVTITIE
jgi:hypothetical protein